MNSIIQLYKESYSGFSKEIWLLSLITLINRSGTMVMLFMSIYVTEELGFSLSKAGIVMSCFGIGSFLGAYIGGKLTDVIGYYYVMLLSLVLSGFSFFCILLFDSFYFVCLAVLITTLLGDSFRPANFVAIKAYSREDNRTRAMALIRLAVNVGFALGPAIGGMMAQNFGYEWVFILDGITCIFSGLAMFVLLPNIRIDSAVKKTKESIMEVLRKNKKYAKFLAYSFLIAIAFFQVFTVIPVYLKQVFSYDEFLIGIILALNGLLIAIIEMPLVFLVEGRRSKIKLIAFGSFLVGLSFFLLSLNLIWIVIPFLFIIIITLGEILNFPFAASWALAQSDDANAGQYMGIYTMNFSASTIISPIIGFKLVEWFDYPIMWGFMFVICLIAAVGINRLE